MKKQAASFLFLVFLAQTVPAFAGFWYIVAKDKTIVGKSDVQPKNISSMDLRSEKAVYSELDLPVEDAILKSNSIQPRKKTAAEVLAATTDKELKDEELAISSRSRKIAVDSLKAEGKVFKRVSDFGS